MLAVRVSLRRGPVRKSSFKLYFMAALDGETGVAP